MNTDQAQSTKRQRKPHHQKRFSSMLVFLLVLAAVIAILSYLLHTVSPSPRNNLSQEEMETTSVSDGNNPSSITSHIAKSQNQSSLTEQPEGISQTSQNIEASQPGSTTETGNNSADSSKSPASDYNSTELQTTESQSVEIAPMKLVRKLNAFYSQLDSRPYMRDFKLQEPSREHFSKLIQKLLDNPPVVTRETDDLFTLLKNTAHFFRVLGKNNVLLLKGILDREHDSLETIMKTLYGLTSYPNIVQREYNIQLSEAPLVDYCGFFLSTMGGRLYLFRRDSNSRMIVTYYAILLLNQAHKNGNNRLGIDLLPPIRSLIEELENGGRNLTMRDQYLDKLYTLEEYYESRIR